MVGEIFVDVREGFKIALRMRGRRARGGFGVRAKVAVGGAIDLHRLVEPFHEHRIRLFLVPFDAAFLAIDADVDIVFLADADLRTVQHAFGAAFEAEQHVAVVIQLAALDKSRDVGGEFLNLETGDVFGEVLGMRADITHAAGRAAAFGIGAPTGLFLPGDFDARGQPALRILDDDFADFAELARSNHVARFLHQRITSVIMSQAVEQAGFLHQLGELFSLGQIEGGRFVTEHVETLFERHLRGREVHVVGGHNGDEIHALAFGQPRLGLDHFLKRAVAAFRLKEEVRSRRARTFRVR